MRIENAGEQAIVLSVSYDETSDSVASVRRILNHIVHHRHPAIVSIRPGLDCILIEHSIDSTFSSWLQELEQTEFHDAGPDVPVEVCDVPVCYDFGSDIPGISERKGLSREQIIELHSSKDYSVWMIGFMPGFPYLGALPVDLQMERKLNPDPVIPASSVAIAEEYVGIYPVQSPGGWHVIGRTPWKIIDYTRKVPWTFDYGMRVRFHPISIEEFEKNANF